MPNISIFFSWLINCYLDWKPPCRWFDSNVLGSSVICHGSDIHATRPSSGCFSAGSGHVAAYTRLFQYWRGISGL